MKPVYEIKFMGSDDFDSLPLKETNGADISDSLGFYNPHTKRIFIRHTAIPELDKYLLTHEFEHVLEEKATDEDEYGIRHKKFFKQFLLPLFTGYNAESGNFSPLGAIGNTGGKPKEEEQSAQPSQLSGYGNLGFGIPGSGSSTPVSGSSINPLNDQQSSGQGLNQGLSQQSVNPLNDPYAQYGQQQGRLIF